MEWKSFFEERKKDWNEKPDPEGNAQKTVITGNGFGAMEGTKGGGERREEEGNEAYGAAASKGKQRLPSGNVKRGA
ncbi:MAG: hypothetical protein EAY75_15295 [Bacteroidetes bacterium]|nr:MAG: hypothetical protein EAY75_15295 [Bacteroidota bacterium]